MNICREAGLILFCSISVCNFPYYIVNCSTQCLQFSALPVPPEDISNNFFNLGSAHPMPHMMRGPMPPRGPPHMMPLFMRGPPPPGRKHPHNQFIHVLIYLRPIARQVILNLH